MSIIKITEELDRLQKKVSAMRDIYKLYPDTVVKAPYPGSQDETYLSHSISKDVDTIRFAMEKSWFNAYTSKRIGCIEVYTPVKFALFAFFPGDMIKQLIVQNYHDSMRKQYIPDSIIRECDIKVISFIKDRSVNLATTNLREVRPDTTIGKLLSLL